MMLHTATNTHMPLQRVCLTCRGWRLSQRACLLLLLLNVATALHALLVSGDGTAAAQCLADMASEVQRMEPNNAALMVQLVSRSSTVLLSACCGPLCCALLRVRTCF